VTVPNFVLEVGEGLTGKGVNSESRVKEE